MTTGDIVKLKVNRLPHWKKGDRVHISSIHQCRRCGEVEVSVIHLEHMDEADFDMEELEITGEQFRVALHPESDISTGRPEVST